MHLKTVNVLLFTIIDFILNTPGAGGSLLINSNAIKNLPSGVGQSPSESINPVSASPDNIFLYDGGSKNQAIDNYQHFTCVDDEDCSHEEFCHGSRITFQVCLPCRKRKKRCLRDAMCCPGNHCNNGMCVANEHEQPHHGEIEETIIESFGYENHHVTADSHPRRTTLPSRPHSVKGQEGDSCLRSSDCGEGLCCARHFWSKICKPVLKEGQVCTKHKRKGSHSLEIFQRCDCGDGLSCRTQRNEHSTSRLHTCQKHAVES
ncbi:dickkopf-related protein 1 isoform X2 [Protopterus annectens]|uniref:dickkopf-related protein 1 isoform X2 n=1 Tax=Protopterus annectens TaxID=7888 RepID=UPI001CF9D0B0|nr:dickkopf-related protein 1 isoform X2 [Protopterus annectens]